MKRASLLAAAAVVLIANVFALAHAWRNRYGPVTSDITLSQREVSKAYDTINEDSGVALHLLWTDPQQWHMLDNPLRWLDQKSLQELGFDTSLAPSDHAAFEFYQRQRARRAFVALEYDGPSWRKWIDEVEHQAQRQIPLPASVTLPDQRETSPRLVAIDASSNAVRLRARYPDHGSVIIVPAVIRIGLQPEDAKRPAQLYGTIWEIPSSIHVPVPFSDAFRRLPRDRSTKYRVHLRYGALLEPWIVGVELPTPAGR